MNILKRIDEIRKAQGLSVYELAKRTGISNHTMYMWKKDNYTPSLASLQLICEKGFNISLVEFFATESNLMPVNEEIAKLLEKWNLLNETQKQALMQLINSYINK